jgi:hypothetical protein
MATRGKRYGQKWGKLSRKPMPMRRPAKGRSSLSVTVWVVSSSSTNSKDWVTNNPYRRGRPIGKGRHRRFRMVRAASDIFTLGTQGFIQRKSGASADPGIRWLHRRRMAAKVKHRTRMQSCQDRRCSQDHTVALSEPKPRNNRVAPRSQPSMCLS